MIHIPGVKHRATDCLSRHPTDAAVQLILPDDVAVVDTEDSVVSTAVSTLNALSIRSVTWDRVRTATASDHELLNLSDLIEHGFPTTRSDVPEHIRGFFQFRDDLSTVDGVILYKDRVVIPPLSLDLSGFEWGEPGPGTKRKYVEYFLHTLDAPRYRVTHLRPFLWMQNSH